MMRKRPEGFISPALSFLLDYLIDELYNSSINFAVSVIWRKAGNDGFPVSVLAYPVPLPGESGSWGAGGHQMNFSALPPGQALISGSWIITLA